MSTAEHEARILRDEQNVERLKVAVELLGALIRPSSRARLLAPYRLALEQTRACRFESAEARSFWVRIREQELADAELLIREAFERKG